MYNQSRTTHTHTHAHTHTNSSPVFHLWKAPGPQACWEIISQASERGNSIAARRKKGFFNGEKWEAGEELAVAAGIIDGNCLGTRLRFMGRTTHGGWKTVCSGGMKDIRQHFDCCASLIDRIVPDAVKKKNHKGFQSFLEWRLERIPHGPKLRRTDREVEWKWWKKGERKRWKPRGKRGRSACGRSVGLIPQTCWKLVRRECELHSPTLQHLPLRSLLAVC